MSDFTLEQLQHEHEIWAAHNFPNTQPWEPLLGMNEELGELEEALHLFNVADTYDAIMDMVVFATHYATVNNIEIENYFITTGSVYGSIVTIDVAMKGLAMQLGKLNHFHLKGHQKIRYHQDVILINKRYHLMNIFQLLVKIHNLENIEGPIGAGSFLDTLEKVWNKVKQRDWIKKTLTAHEDMLNEKGHNKEI